MKTFIKTMILAVGVIIIFTLPYAWADFDPPKEAPKPSSGRAPEVKPVKEKKPEIKNNEDAKKNKQMNKKRKKLGRDKESK